jgi:hypothetical protein
MNIKKGFRGFLSYFSLVFLVLLLIFISIKSSFSLPETDFFASQTLNSVFVVFLAILVWLISPVGCLSIAFSGWRRKGSILGHKVSGFTEFFSMITWLSFMLILMLIYIDEVYLGILSLGSDILYLAIVSGFAFGFLVILKSFWRKAISDNTYASNHDNDFIEGEFKKRVCDCDDCDCRFGEKTAFTGIKEKVKNRIKKDLKEIVNEEIDKRF